MTRFAARFWGAEMDIANAFALLANFVILPAIAYGAQLSLGALGVTIIFGIPW
jgi:branched-chain amino acid transport system permease protein